MCYRHYRHAREETPSHPGGVSSAARDKVEKRHRDKERGISASSSSKDKRKDREKDRRRRRGNIEQSYFIF